MKKSTYVIIAIFLISLIVTIFINQGLNYKDKDLFDRLNVFFSNLKTSAISGAIYVPENPEFESTKVKAYDIIVSENGDSATFSFDVINDSKVDAKIDALIKLEPRCISLAIPANLDDEELVCSNLNYKLVYAKNNQNVQINDILKAGSKENLNLEISYINSDNISPINDVQITFYDLSLIYDKTN